MPQYNLAIEYCGLYWHSEQQGKTRSYHKIKYDECRKNGIRLLTIFEDEWKERRPQIEAKLLHLVNKSTESLYARRLGIQLVTEKTEFFDRNHIQGDGPGSITYGLYNDKTLVAAMTFIQKANGEYILNRYATSTRVVGGFSKLLSHFKKQHYWKTIVSFADLRWSVGDLYQSTGWTLDKLLPPDYSYSPDTQTRSHKFNYRRKNLPRLLKIFDSTLSEWENCKLNNVYKIWDCGKLRFVINNLDI